MRALYIVLVAMLALPVVYGQVHIERELSETTLRTTDPVLFGTNVIEVTLHVTVEGEEPFLIIKETIPKNMQILETDLVVENDRFMSLLLCPEVGTQDLTYTLMVDSQAMRKGKWEGWFVMGTDYLTEHPITGDDRVYIEKKWCETTADQNGDRKIDLRELRRFKWLHWIGQITTEEYHLARQYYAAKEGC